MFKELNDYWSYIKTIRKMTTNKLDFVYLSTLKKLI